MKKLIKRFSILLIAALCTVCMAAFVACGDDNGDELATDKIYITVLDENSNAINGTTFGEGDYNPDNHQVQIQFCTVDGDYGCSLTTPNVGADGKAVFDLAELKEFVKANNSTTVELHILGVTKVGYKKGENSEYGKYKVSEMPKNITVTLEKA